MRKKLLISFSGGLTSAYMTKMLLDSLDPAEWEIIVVYANTGMEHEETLKFIRNCDNYFGFNTVWVEAVVNPIRGKGTTHKIVDYYTASREGEPFEPVIIKYGIPNIKCKHCTRELKIQPIHSYAKRELGWKNYLTAIGIRADESKRCQKEWNKEGFVYPLVLHPTTRPDVNLFWHQQPFTLNLTSYQGNCTLCFEKTDRKLITICKEWPWAPHLWIRLEKKYAYHIPAGRKSRSKKPAKPPFFFFRNKRSTLYFVEKATQPFEPAIDESKILPADIITNINSLKPKKNDRQNTNNQITYVP